MAKILDAVKLRPELTGIHFPLGKSYFDLENLDKALLSLRRTVELIQKNEFQVALSRLFERLGNLGKAISNFQLVINLAAGTYITGDVAPTVPENVHLHEDVFNKSLPNYFWKPTKGQSNL